MVDESQSFDTIEQIQYDTKMTDDFTLDPARTYKPKQPVVAVKTAVPDLDLAAIDAMPEDEIRTLCKRMARQCGLIARMTQEETAQAMLDTLAQTALKPIVMGLNMKADIQSRMTAIDKWLDRTKGRPAQSVALEVKGNVQHTHNVELSAEIMREQIERILKKKPVVIENQ